MNESPPPLQQTPQQLAQVEYTDLLRALYKSVLHKEVSEEDLLRNVAQILQGGASIEAVIATFLNSPQRHQIEQARHRPTIDIGYHTPTGLQQNSPGPNKVLLLGSCMMDGWKTQLSGKCSVDHIPLNHFPELPENPPSSVENYDFQIIQLPLRSILPEKSYLALDYNNPASYEDLYDRTLSVAEMMLENNMKWNLRDGLLTFVCNFFTPQQNLIGRFAIHGDLRNPIYFTDRLNSDLQKIVTSYKNAHMLDIEKISRIYGKKYIQDDAYLWLSHQGLGGDYDDDRHRIEQPVKYSQMHSIASGAFIHAAWNEAVAMWRSISGVDNIKLVIIDLDDTLWRGIAAEGALENFGPLVLEGWPIGVIEALKWLKSRGVILAIASKNNEATIEKLWPEMTRDLISLDDFAVRRINWNSKVDNIGEIINIVNVLPKNTLFIDDNPIERDAVEKNFPGIRVLGKNLYDIRRTLLWAPELQVPIITEESARKTAMLQGQVAREALRHKFSREEFLKSLNLNLKFKKISNVSDPSFSRAFELLNKTNQFNTTGTKWELPTAEKFFLASGEFWTVAAQDKFTDYGIISVLAIQSNRLEQFVMSCRAFGLDIEYATLAFVTDALRSSGFKTLKAMALDTDYNLSSRDIFARAGFKQSRKTWVLSLTESDISMPAHIKVSE